MTTKSLSVESKLTFVPNLKAFLKILCFVDVGRTFGWMYGWMHRWITTKHNPSSPSCRQHGGITKTNITNGFFQECLKPSYMQCNHNFSVGYCSSEAKTLKCLLSPCSVRVCNSWTGAIGYVRLKVDGPVLLPRKQPPSQSPYSKCCKLVRCSIGPLSLISCMT